MFAFEIVLKMKFGLSRELFSLLLSQKIEDLDREKEMENTIKREEINTRPTICHVGQKGPAYTGSRASKYTTHTNIL